MTVNSLNESAVANPPQTAMGQTSFCVVCRQSVRATVLLRERDGAGVLARCPQCELCFADPQPTPEQITAYYNGLYAELAHQKDPGKFDWAKESMAEYVRVLKELGMWPRRRMLDYGGGLG